MIGEVMMIIAVEQKGEPMDNAKAIDLLDNLIGMIDDNQNNDYDAAFRMAIDALKTQLYREDATSDLISRRAAIEAIEHRLAEPAYQHTGEDWYVGMNCAENEIYELPSAQPERDIPVKPNETTDTAWGIPHRQAVCPKCDYYLGHVVFLGDGKGKKVTYCETCGQAIDWEGWDSENEQA